MWISQLSVLPPRGAYIATSGMGCLETNMGSDHKGIISNMAH